MKNLFPRKTNAQLSEKELQVIYSVISKTKKGNMDNISRTNAYFDFYLQYPEIKWSFLASMVSRNGGWNMCDLQGEWFPKIIPDHERNYLFLTFERANWLIFQDAFPQLLLYHYSTKYMCSMFHLLPFFHVSKFMEKEWNAYWIKRNNKRLMTSLIINEQNVIQKPVIEHPVYRKKVFRSFYFLFQDWFHFSSVLFPTCTGELYGASVNGFSKVDKRIDLGKRLSDILFTPKLYPHFLEFALKTEHTGSRTDYERYIVKKMWRDTPYLRTTFPVIAHHIRKYQDWSDHQKVKKVWFKEVKHKHPFLITNWYLEKQKQMRAFITLGEIFR